MTAKTVGELKAMLNMFDDDTKIISASGNYEMRGALLEGVSLITRYFSKKEEVFYDSFDYTPYSQDIYEIDKNGEPCLWIC